MCRSLIFLFWVLVLFGTVKVEASPDSPAQLDTATFSAGCFWHVENVFRHVKGVDDVTCGYTGGTTKDPTYEDVCSGSTHHAESVEVKYDPKKVSYGELLNVFWENHDPTTVNAQGPDHGEQYRSAIFYHSAEQKAAALASEQKLAASGKVKRPIVTQILPAGPFYKAEEYHQRYVEKHGGADACAVHL
ncbi:MAG: peptide-methionine (S)-S-oxide reductase MsrA [Candidatus Obscuribacterales bacterium]|nr:peptide-methionine (S)-S-oxide reductase MsrA [Candidatus Obscuribacterales bacterium]